MTETSTRTVPMAWICKDDTIIFEDGTLTIEHIGPPPKTLNRVLGGFMATLVESG